MKYKIEKLSNLGKEESKEVSKIFIQGFGHMFKGFSKDEKSMAECFEKSFVKSLFYVALENNKVLGFIAISNNKTRAIKLNREAFYNKFGKLKTFIFCSQIGLIIEKPEVKEESECYIDFLAVNEDYRNKGVATELLNYVHKSENYKDYYIEVLSKNIGAKRLYEKVGYEVIKVSNNIFMKIQKLGSIERMKLRRI